MTLRQRGGALSKSGCVAVELPMFAPESLCEAVRKSLSDAKSHLRSPLVRPFSLRPVQYCLLSCVNRLGAPAIAFYLIRYLASNQESGFGVRLHLILGCLVLKFRVQLRRQQNEIPQTVDLLFGSLALGPDMFN